MSVVENVRKDAQGNAINTGGVLLRVTNGQFLVYKLTTLGPIPSFSLVDEQQGGSSTLLMDSAELQSTYETTWPNPPDDPVAPGETHEQTLCMNFTGTTGYTYTVEVRRRDGSLRRRLVLIDYSSPDHEPEHCKSLTVTTA